MNAFLDELDQVHSAIGRLPSGGGIYSLPWYLVLGNPGSGRSTAIQALDLSWPSREPLAAAACSYWLSNEAVFAEPTGAVVGPRKDPAGIEAYCQALRKKRPREPIDGVLMIVSAVDFVDQTEEGVEEYANGLRSQLIELGRHIGANVPVYVVVTQYDTLFGFGDVFQWKAERAREEAWGFLLPVNTPTEIQVPKLKDELRGLAARFEATCLSELSSDDNAEQRIRAFQHLSEVRLLMEKLEIVLGTLGLHNAYERAPWIRGLIIGAARPGTGDRIRAGLARFNTLGLAQGHLDPNRRPGGLPIHSYMKSIVLRERDIVPLRLRWRDDWIIIIGVILGTLLWVGAVVWYFVAK